jgi:hypothetical protein
MCGKKPCGPCLEKKLRARGFLKRGAATTMSDEEGGGGQTPNTGEPGEGEGTNYFANGQDCSNWAEMAAQGHTRCCYACEGEREGQYAGIDMEGPGPC